MNESVIKTLVVALIVCLLCSLVVSSVAVSLRDVQNLNKLNDQRIKVLQAAGIYDDTKSIEEQFNSITSKLIDFENNAIVDSFGDIDLSTYDPVEYSKKDGYFTPIAPNDDIAVIKNREKFGKIFIHFIGTGLDRRTAGPLDCRTAGPFARHQRSILSVA